MKLFLKTFPRNIPGLIFLGIIFFIGISNNDFAITFSAVAICFIGLQTYWANLGNFAILRQTSKSDKNFVEIVFLLALIKSAVLMTILFALQNLMKESYRETLNSLRVSNGWFVFSFMLLNLSLDLYLSFKSVVKVQRPPLGKEVITLSIFMTLVAYLSAIDMRVGVLLFVALRFFYILCRTTFGAVQKFKVSQKKISVGIFSLAIVWAVFLLDVIPNKISTKNIIESPTKLEEVFGNLKVIEQNLSQIEVTTLNKNLAVLEKFCPYHPRPFVDGVVCVNEDFKEDGEINKISLRGNIKAEVIEGLLQSDNMYSVMFALVKIRGVPAGQRSNLLNLKIEELAKQPGVLGHLAAIALDADSQKLKNNFGFLQVSPK